MPASPPWAVLSAVLTFPHSGRCPPDGQKVQLTRPRHALSHGIALISQEPTLVPQRTVLDNVFLGQEVGPLGFVGVDGTWWPSSPRSLSKAASRSPRLLVSGIFDG